MIKYWILLLSTLMIIGCSDEDGDLDTSRESESFDLSEASGFSPSGSGDDNNNNGEPGLITAGEWSDLDNWDFWTNIIGQGDHEGKPGYWEFYTDNRISLQVNNNFVRVVNAELRLEKDGQNIWTTKTDNLGRAELWVEPFGSANDIQLSEYDLIVNGRESNADLHFFEDGVNEIFIDDNGSTSTRVELSFIVDATGSMSDELEFLKEDLLDVIRNVESNNGTLDIHTSSVFYRDEGDEYLVRQSDFTSDINNTLGFIRDQFAGGGGDFPEAVHSAMEVGIDGLDWSADARTRIAFLLLDAPPHHNMEVIEDLQQSIKAAASKGIKVIPITASGINKETEFLMRFFSILTNGTYVFITNDSGIGNVHIEASVGDYEVEFLNDLMVRLINECSTRI